VEHKKIWAAFFTTNFAWDNSRPPSVDEPIRDEARAEFNQPWNFGDSLLQR
jgi:hypothetical protein